jgi:hypothetical protein
MPVVGFLSVGNGEEVAGYTYLERSSTAPIGEDSTRGETVPTAARMMNVNGKLVKMSRDYSVLHTAMPPKVALYTAIPRWIAV